jgi:hypothetical protein
MNKIKVINKIIFSILAMALLIVVYQTFTKESLTADGGYSLEEPAVREIVRLHSKDENGEVIKDYEVARDSSGRKVVKMEEG